MNKLINFARKMRIDATDAERKLWYALNREQLGFKFRRQHPLPPYIVDFYCPEQRLVVEIDGGQHADNTKDEIRTKFIESQGYKILRFWNNDVLTNLEGTIQTIVNELKSPPPIIPLPSAKGGGWSRLDFPIFRNNPSLVYLDTAASAQKPTAVIEAMAHAADTHYANIHRGVYRNSQVTTEAFEAVREKVAKFINAPDARGIVFTRNTTEAINLVAASWGRANLKEGDEIILSAMEHHANIVPWQMLRDELGTVIKVIPLTAESMLDMAAYEKLLSAKTKLVAVTHISNAIGVINDVASIIQKSKAYNKNIVTLIDASQSVVHTKVDMQALGCDFLAFTGHKLYGPTGVGVLAAKYELLESMPPYQGGGDMIETVTWDKTTYRAPPARFEAGTPAILEVIGLGAAIDYLGGNFYEAEHALTNYTTQALNKIEGLTIYAADAPRAGIFSMNLQGINPTDVAEILNQQDIAVRSGHHCCMPLMQSLGIEASFRLSLGLYNTKDDIDKFVEGLAKAKKLLS